jgi:hypothetical protein
MTRVLDSEKARTDVKYYTEAMEYIESLSLERETNFLVSHHPFLAIACNDTEIITADWTLQQALGSNTLDRVSAVISGHQHWFQLLEFDGDALPAQLVVGHGGTKLIKNYVNQDSLSRIRLNVGRPEPALDRSPRASSGTASWNATPTWDTTLRFTPSTKRRARWEWRTST